MDFIRNIVAKNKTLLKIAIFSLKTFRRLIYTVFSFLPLKSNHIIFCSHLGRNYSCNPKAIYEEIIKDDRFKNHTIIWAFKRKDEYQIPKGKIVKYNSIKYLYYLAISKYWIFNAKMPYYFKKRKGQVYLQTWHGTPLKKLAADIEVGEDITFYRSEINKHEMIMTYLKDSARYDYMISANEFSTKAFMSAFKIERDILIETGYPRNDILVNSSKDDIDKLKDIYGIPKDKKVILYAPTWRDNAYDVKGYVFELKVDFEKWYKALGDDYLIIYKPHYLIYNTYNKNLRKGFVYDASKCDDINDLYLMSDILITDYSSVFFDYGVLKRPILFYMYDLEEYRDQLRGFYLDIYKDLPGPIYEDEDQLLKAIVNIKQVVEKYSERTKVFYDRFCKLNDGKSSTRVIDIVFKDV